MTSAVPPFIVASIALLAVLAALLATTRAVRGRAERLSNRRQDRWRDALTAQSEPDLRALAEGARWGRIESDLVALLSAGNLPAQGVEAALLRRAVAQSKLKRALRRRLTSRRPERRATSVLLLGALETDDPTPELEPLLHDEDHDVRAAAVRALAQRSSPEAAYGILRGLRDNVLPPERLVERIGAPWALEPLLNSCEAEDFREVRGWLAEALGVIGDSCAEPVLTGLLRSSDEDERARACRALGRVNKGDIGPELFDALRDSSWVVRAQAARAVATSPDGRTLPDLVTGLADPAWWVRANCAEALTQYGNDGRAVLELVAARHQDNFARERAQEALALSGAMGVAS